MRRADDRLTLRELVSVTGCRRFMLLKVFVDDSSDEKQQKAIAAGAFVGFTKQWTNLKNEWMKRLKPDGLKYFRSTEYYSLQGEFRRYRDPIKYPKPAGSNAASALRNDLDGIIKKTGVMGIAAVIPIEAYNDVRANEPGAALRFSEDPFESALQTLIQECVKVSREDLHSSPVEFICDDGPSSARIAVAYRSFMARNLHFDGIAQALVHRDDKKLVPLQSADLMAHLSREFYSNWILDPTDVNLNRLNKSVYKIIVWSKSYMLEEMAATRRTLARPRS
jgi:hypothetical protein